jgi:Cu(I)/Ag(I) efflux system protein CusF
MVRAMIVVAMSSLLLTAGAWAQTGRTEGEIRKVDKDLGKITLRHGPITGDLDMPGMSMVLQVKDRSLLDRLQVGEQIEATILKEGSVFFLQSAEKKNR